jgi:succinoglycan biosynthesis protein ExoA
MMPDLAPAAADGRLAVSFVVPVYNGADTLGAALDAILAEDDGRPLEVLVVDDGSSDDSREIARRRAATGKVRVLEATGRGAATAINLGVQAARHPVICQVDQDVIVQPGWLGRITAALAEAPDAAAAQGYYSLAHNAGVWGRVMGLDLMQRYARVEGPTLDHVCSGNSAYRRQALTDVGLFDPSLGYGYDNDLSYRLGRAGFRLLFSREARSIHRWRASLWRYLVQQYGFGYGRLDVIAKHPRRFRGDEVSPFGMILHAGAAVVALVLLLFGALAALWGGRWAAPVIAGLAALGALATERALAGVRAARRFHDPAALLFPVAHLLRDLSWALAVVVWTARRIGRWRRGPVDSMVR